tara:strand:+ start:1522 stop:1752 length:231 start_codon:yes stop_codon:yes gene_type:complete
MLGAETLDAVSDQSVDDAVLVSEAVVARLARLSVRTTDGAQSVAGALALPTPRRADGLRALGRLTGGRLRGTMSTW